ncbi:MAG: NHL repeat-containing protein [Verrucomicrobia bacterium]|nr:NHL repeat-containing protein [Verrucomicrobiota bacterium]
MAKLKGDLTLSKLICCLVFAFLAAADAPALTLKVGDIFVANFGGNNILKVDPKSGALQNWGAVAQPTDVAPSSDGFIYITSLNNTVSKLCIGNGSVTPLSSGGLLNQPYGIVLGPSGDLFVTSFANSVVVQVDHVTGAQTLVASGGSLSGPLGIAFNAAGNLVVANYNTSSILQINPTNGTQTVILSGNGLNHPHHLILDASGAIFVGNDVLNAGNIIQRVTPGSTTVTNISVGGKLKSPRGIAISGSGKLISAQFDNRQIVSVDSTNGIQTGITSVGGLLNQPYGVAVYNFPAVPPDVCSPDLNIAQGGPNVVLSWPTNSMGFTLQTTMDLLSPDSWTSVTNAVQVAGTNYLVTVDASGGPSFFRLRK